MQSAVDPAPDPVGPPPPSNPSRALRAAMVVLKPFARTVVQFFLDEGLALHHACGMAAQAHGESSFNARAIGDGGHASGLFQLHSDRTELIRIGCGVDVRALPPAADQLRGVWYELNHSERGALKRLRATTCAYDAGFIACKYYERPANKAVDCPKRGGYAQAWYDVFAAEGLTGKGAQS